MSAKLLHEGATVKCVHSGQAQPMAPNPRVKIRGKMLVTRKSPYTIAGCSAYTQCSIANWNTAATRVKANGDPVLLSNSKSRTVNGTELKILVTEKEVSGK